MRVLQVIAEMVSGGAEAVVEELARGLPTHGWEVAVASAGGRRVSTLHSLGARTLDVPLARRSPRGVLAAQAALARAGREVRPDVLHAHNVGATLTAHLGVRRLKRAVPLVSTFHGVAAADYARAAWVLSRCADEILVVAPEIGARLCAAGLRGVRVSVVANAVSPPATHDRASVRTSLGLALDVPVALCVARLVQQKRHDVLLKAWAELGGDAVLLLAGAGPLSGPVAAQVESLGLKGRVRLLGERADVDRLLAATDAVVLSSDWEGLPMSLLEALAAGVPIVATDVDGVAAAVGSKAARLVPRRNTLALAGALREVLGNPSLRHEMGAAGRTRSTERFSAACLVADHARIYDRLAASAVG